MAHIDVIQPTTMFARLSPKRRTEEPMEEDASDSITDDVTPAASCNTSITISCLQDLYNVAGYVPRAANKGNKIGITGQSPCSPVQITELLRLPCTTCK